MSFCHSIGFREKKGKNFKVLEAYVAISKRTCSVNGTGYKSSKVEAQYVNRRFVLHLRSRTSLGAYALR